jgi:hypothetical protein
VTEQESQQHFRVAVTRAKIPLRLWRQPAGSILAKRGGAVECAPVGAADLTGGVTRGPRKGVRIEIEMKGPDTPTTKAQRTWEAFCRASGFLYLRIRYDADRSLDENLERAVAAVREAIG